MKPDWIVVVEEALLTLVVISGSITIMAVTALVVHWR